MPLTFLRSLPALFLVAFALTPQVTCAEAPSRDRLDRPAPLTRLFASTPLAAVGKAGPRLVAVGIRGLIVLSDDAGKSWRQVASPVASDLVAVQFPTASAGWIVGHDGVVLHSADGGLTWVRQLDGRAAKTLLTDHFTRRVQAGDAGAQRWLDDVRLNYADGPEQALLDVWFEDEQRGFVVGSFGTIFQTLDGGKTWQPWMDRVASKELVHLNAVKGIGGQIFIVSERGTLFRLDRARNQFEPVTTGYQGSLFSIAGRERSVVAVGLLGNAFHSIDGGTTWRKLETGLGANLTHVTELSDGRLLVVAADGGAVAIDSESGQRAPLRVKVPVLLTGAVQAEPGAAVLVGITGPQRVELR
jgi:photosystem II stability/assembly factor-like uncharacterized protein